jgi:Holliday junction resolvase RusA-like endonuclease
MIDLLPWPHTLDPLLAMTIGGDPAGQGSIRTFANGGMTYPKNTVNHRNRVIERLETEWAGRPPILGPVAVRVVFTFRRPDTHYKAATKTGRPARTELKDDAPDWHTTKLRGDLDKCQRLLGDALEISRVIDHDSLIVQWQAEKPFGETAFTTFELYRPNGAP